MAIVAWLAQPIAAQDTEILEMTCERHWILEGAGESSAWRYGHNVAVAGIGDVNGDSIPDVIMGNSLADGGGPRNGGTATVYSGKDGTRIWEVHGRVGERLGFSVAGAGDVDADGVPDVIVGAPHGEPPPVHLATTGGSAYVYSGRDGTRIWEFHGTINPIGHGDLLGWSVAGAGDVNGDGFGDVIVGAPHADQAYVYSGRDGSTIWEFQGIPWGLFTALDYLGHSVAGAGDVNQDGFADVIVGVPSGLKSTGYVHVYSGRDGTRIWQYDTRQGAAFGHAVAGAGDVDGDDIPDVIVGQPRTNSVFAYSGRDGRQIWRVYGYGGLGWSVAGAGDVNHDGVADVVAGAPLTLGGAGSAYVFSGKDGATIARVDGAGGDKLGLSVAGVGYVNNDLWSDVIVGLDGGPAGSRSAYVCTYVPVPALFAIGSGTAGLEGTTPGIGTGGEIARLGSTTFSFELTNARGSSPCLLAGSLAPANVSLQGMSLYGDFLTPGVFATWGHMTNGSDAGTNGSAVQPMPIPNDPALSGLTTYWQWFVMDSGSPLPIGVSHTRGIGARLIR